MSSLSRLPDSSVTSPLGFSAGAGSAGLKSDATPDVAVLVSNMPCSCAGVFTQNRVRAAPILYDEALLGERPGRLRGIVMNSVVANACTGDQGLEGAAAMAVEAEQALDLPTRCMLVLSTGAIGVPLPVEAVTAGIRAAANNVRSDGGEDVAKAIMTTDRKIKHLAVQVEAATGTVTVAGVAKGSGMIHPNMATLLAIITTDAIVEAARLGVLLRSVTDRTFNAITVDGDTSPNDAVLLLANGASEVAITRDADAWKRFEQAVEQVAQELALMIVQDSEGASRFIEITVAGAGTEAMARSVGRCIGTSALVKTALSRGEPDWGCILAAAGSSGLPIEPDRLRLLAQVRAATGGPDGEWALLADGGTGADLEASVARKIFSAPSLAIRLELGMGGAVATTWTCDLSDGQLARRARGTPRG